MNASSFTYGFRVLDGKTGVRRLINGAAAFRGYADCIPAAELDREAYLSAFTFHETFRAYLDEHRTTRGYAGPYWAAWLWFDIDRDDDIQAAAVDTRRLVTAIVERYQLADDDVLIFYSGAKGYHIGIPTALWMPEPSAMFHRIARRFAIALAELAGVTIDTGVYASVNLFRAPNSRHPRTGLYKRRLSADELFKLNAEAHQRLAAQPEPFGIPSPGEQCLTAAADWNTAAEHVRREAEAKAVRSADGPPTLNRSTLEYIRDGASNGDRHRLLFSAAANLAELGCPAPLAHALLSDAALDCGLSPSDVRRQIDCGLEHAAGLPGVMP